MLIADWTLTRTAPGAWRDPAAIDDAAAWLPAIVPGTLGAALRALDLWHPDDDVAFDATDAWYRASVTGAGAAALRFEGLATIAEVYLDGVPILASDNMFLAHEVDVELSGTHALHIAFRSLDAHLATRKARARWRPTLIRPPSLRLVRTLLLGHMPGWGPPVHAVGPHRAVALLDATKPRVVERRVATWIDPDGDGLVDLAIRLSDPVDGWVTARVGTIDFVLVDEGDGCLRGRAEVPEVARWWPHTHGDAGPLPARRHHRGSRLRPRPGRVPHGGGRPRRRRPWLRARRQRHPGVLPGRLLDHPRHRGPCRAPARRSCRCWPRRAKPA